MIFLIISTHEMADDKKSSSMFTSASTLTLCHSTTVTMILFYITRESWIKYGSLRKKEVINEELEREMGVLMKLLDYHTYFQIGLFISNSMRVV